MDDRNLIQSILDGISPSERPIDVLHMCLTANTIRMAVRSNQPVRAMEFYDSLKIVGEILCPIFTPVKPKVYIDGMIAMRRHYAGIASDAYLQGEFANAITARAQIGELDSLNSAIDAQLWLNLGGGAVA